MIELFGVALRAVLDFPRHDANGHGLNVDLHQLRLVSPEGSSMYLEKLNCDDVVLWGSEFVRVDFSRSTFRNCDLGSAFFEDCGLEDLDMAGAKLAHSPLDERPTTFKASWMSRSNIEAAHVLQSSNPQVLFSRTEVDGLRLDQLRSVSQGVGVQ